jgi:hypothetical protein
MDHATIRGTALVIDGARKMAGGIGPQSEREVAQEIVDGIDLEIDGVMAPKTGPRIEKARETAPRIGTAGETAHGHGTGSLKIGREKHAAHAHLDHESTELALHLFLPLLRRSVADERDLAQRLRTSAQSSRSPRKKCPSEALTILHKHPRNTVVHHQTRRSRTSSPPARSPKPPTAWKAPRSRSNTTNQPRRASPRPHNPGASSSSRGRTSWTQSRYGRRVAGCLDVLKRLSTTF